MPIVAALAGNLHVNPMLLLVPAALSTSFAFMLPIATPPNAIVFSSGELKVIDMLKPGAVANVVCSVALWAYFQLLAPSGDGESPGSSAVLWPLRAVLWGPTLAQFATGEPDWAVTAWEDAAGNETGC
jgi:Na+/H+ antiporter NhaD/arsenite permease-like protein